MKNEITGKVGVTIGAPPEKVWEALTQPQLIKKYLFGTDTVTTWRVGSPITFKGEYEGKSYEDKGTIMAVEPNKLLQYTYWSSMSGEADKPENYATVTFRLTNEHGKTRLELTQENIKDEQSKEHSEKNWTMVLNTMKGMVEGGTEVLAF